MSTFQTPEPVTIDVEVGVAVIRIAAEPSDTTSAEVRPSDPAKKSDVMAAEQTTIDFASGRLEIRSPRNWRQMSPLGGRGSVDIDVHAPCRSSMSVSGGVADLHITGDAGDVDYRSGVGNLRLDDSRSLRVKTGVGGVHAGHIEGLTEVKTGSGKVHLGLLEGSTSVKNANGETTIERAAGDLRVHSSNGRIAVEQSDSTVVVKTSNGDIRLGRVTGGSVSAHTAKGGIEIGVPEGVAAWLDLHTSFGAVDNQLEEVDGPTAHDSTVQVRAQTSLGHISVRRANAAAVAPRG